jgi:hypothetical protein
MPIMGFSATSLIVIVTTLAQAPVEQPAANERQDRLEFLTKLASELTLISPADKQATFALTPQPVLHYDNATGLSTDGVTFLFLAGTRPAAAVSFSIRRTPQNAVYRECTSLWREPLDCQHNGASFWSPQRGGLLVQRLKDGPMPADGERQRLVQMRNIARRFAVTWHHSRTDEVTELHLMPTPIHRFAAEPEGIVDGALFVFSPTNDPEMLLLLEAVRDKPAEAAYWRYSLARMSSLKELVRLDGDEVWTVSNFHQDATDDRRTGPYSEQRVGTYMPAVASREVDK